MKSNKRLVFGFFRIRKLTWRLEIDGFCRAFSDSMLVFGNVFCSLKLRNHFFFVEWVPCFPSHHWFHCWFGAHLPDGWMLEVQTGGVSNESADDWRKVFLKKTFDIPPLEFPQNGCGRPPYKLAQLYGLLGSEQWGWPRQFPGTPFPTIQGNHLTHPNLFIIITQISTLHIYNHIYIYTHNYSYIHNIWYIYICIIIYIYINIYYHFDCLYHFDCN